MFHSNEHLGQVLQHENHIALKSYVDLEPCSSAWKLWMCKCCTGAGVQKTVVFFSLEMTGVIYVHKNDSQTRTCLGLINGWRALSFVVVPARGLQVPACLIGHASRTVYYTTVALYFWRMSLW